MNIRVSPRKYLTSKKQGYNPDGYREYPKDKCSFCGGISIATINNYKPVEGGYHPGCRQESERLKEQNQ